MKDKNVLLQQAEKVSHLAYAPYSKFHVGACIETESGNLFNGCNVENASYGLTTCAEASAISVMVAAGEKNIKQIAVMVNGPDLSAPCGACRQRLYEFSSPETLIHIGNLKGARATYKMSELLPHAFGPQNLAEHWEAIE